MSTTLPTRQNKPVFIPPKRRTASGKSAGASTLTPTKSVYGDQILNVQGGNPSAGSSADCLVEQDRDVLGSMERLERLPSVGTMRSIRSNGSIPTLERVRRETSNHSIGSHSQTSSGQVSERSTDIDLVREAVHTKRNIRSSRRPPERSESRVSRCSSRSGQGQPSTHTSTDNLDQISVVEVVDKVKEIQSRPLPTLPPNESANPVNVIETPKLQLRINPKDEAIEILNSENINIGGPRNVSLKADRSCSTGPDPSSQLETIGLLQDSGTVRPDRAGFLTVTGTVKRGKNKGECFDVQLKMKKEGLAAVQKGTEKESSSCCGLKKGLHILVLSLLCVPMLWLSCTMYAFYMGTITWYNIFIYFNEQRSCCHTVLVSPCVLLLYPIWIIPVTVLLGIYGGFSQISWNFESWRREVMDPEKGFYGWICNKLALPDCAPYEVVILTSLPHDTMTSTSII